ncbi:dehydrogenase/reductase SDR family member 7-like [Corticium candelabrum]|uniref:dehydrogenase/reductase SDR family member 7-like n=1 Tax=Corticium candelabrum TaxID=121492 RepID=UPI002E27192F|nr:dehydrogenase/reductase SDR family member 7-like [Corticium candelabrum]
MAVLIPLLLSAFAILLSYLLWKFIKADADISLLMKPTPNRLHFKDKVVWITGASSGIGEALARMMSEQGARLIISSRNKEQLEDIQKSMNNGHNVKVLVLDLSNMPNAPGLVRQALDMYGHIDVLVNNAGISCRVPVEEVTDDLLRKIMEVDFFFGQVALTQAVLPDMLERRCGQIVNVLSVLGKFGCLLRAPYSAAKFALNGYMSTLRLEIRAFQCVT